MIKEENTLDALVMIEMCCHILGESTEIITNSRYKNSVVTILILVFFTRRKKCKNCYCLMQGVS